jgi:hypothetical protein
MEPVAGGLEFLHFDDLDGLIVDKKVHEQSIEKAGMEKRSHVYWPNMFSIRAAVQNKVK